METQNFSAPRSIGRGASNPKRTPDPDAGWCGYLRVSDTRQASNGDGLGSQQAAIERWAEEAGVKVTAWESDIAPGTMEALPRRQGFACALGHVKSGSCAGIVVARLDRLARDLATQEFLLIDIGRWGQVASTLPEESRVLESGNDDAQRVLIRQLFGAFAQYERAMLKVRLQAGRINRREQGKWHGGTVPFGFTVDDDSRLVPDPFESPIIARGMNLRERGVILADIAEYWSECGLRLRRAKRWTPEQVKRTLDINRKYGVKPAPIDELAARFLR